MRTRHFDEGREKIQQIWPSHPIGVVLFTKMCKNVEDNQVLQWILQGQTTKFCREKEFLMLRLNLAQKNFAKINPQ